MAIPRGGKVDINMLSFPTKKLYKIGKYLSQLCLYIITCNSEIIKTQEQIINEFIHDDTTALILSDYKQWFSKYAADNVNLKAEQCEELGCFYSDGVYLIDSIKRESHIISFIEVEWNKYICDTLILKNSYNLQSKEKIRKEDIIFFSHRYLIGKVVHLENKIDTVSILFIEGRTTPIFRQTNNHITISTAKKMSLL